jgi:TolB protein
VTTDGAGPAWSPDGSKIAFYSSVTGINQIYVVNADGTGRAQLTSSTGDNGLTFPTWSPDGSKIVYQNDLNGKLYRMNADGSDATAISTGPDFAASYSPDGSKIAFTRVVAGVPQIMVMNADGTSPVQLTTVETNFDPSWSPDGTRIAFTHQGPAPANNNDIYVMNANGTGVVNLTNTTDAFEVSPAWSPDGSKIGYIRNDEVSGEIYVMNADGTGQTNISNSAASEFHLDWQSHPVLTCVFGPKTYTRMNGGGPQNFTETITATPGSYVVDLDDLASAGADGQVKLNGVVIMDGRGTTGEVGPRHYTVPVTLNATNTLQVSLRGKKGSVLRVKICPASVSQCYPDLPAPQLSLQSTTVGTTNVEFQLDISNYASFPNDMFAPSPDLPACGLNTSASRTFVDIYDGNGNYLYGFCALYDAASLNDIWFSTPKESWPAEAYVVLTDRRCNKTYTSNRINLASIL